MDISNVNHRIESRMYDYLKDMAFLRALPEDFKYRSSAIKQVQIDAKFKKEEIVGHFVKRKYNETYNFIEENEHSFIMMKRGCILTLTFPPKQESGPFWISMNLVSESPNAGAEIGKLAEILNPMLVKDKKEKGVWVNFSSKRDNGTVSLNNEFLKCPSLKEISGNYPSETISSINWLFGLKSVRQYGSLIIWHGHPGCGKTYMIRALMKHWSDKYKFVVVTDPEKFSSDMSYYQSISSNPSEYQEDEDGVNVPKPTLFIMEDSADLIIQESRHVHYDKIGKLLNITDGLMGQGKDDILLITFNEKVEKIDQAFVRAGRCIMNHEFGKFSRMEAFSWLKERSDVASLPDEEGHEYSLAELYSFLIEASAEEKRAPSNNAKPKIGFVRHSVK